MTHVVVDPVTRIEGHLRIEAEVDGGQVQDAWSSSTMFRGIEIILKGRDPRDAWAFTQRICGVCTTVHAIASIRAVENAIGARPPPNARILRNLIIAAQCIQDHVIHFYHLHALDWVDVVSALSADPAKTAALQASISDWPNSSTQYFSGVKTRLKDFVDRGQLGPFANAYWGHPAYKLPPEANLMAVAHYLEALDWQREFIKIHAILGGKNPHLQSFLVGGMATPVDPNSQAALNIGTINQLRALTAKGRDFVNRVYLPDVLAIAWFYKDWAGHGAGAGNYLVYGEYPENDSPSSPLFLPAGVIWKRDLSKVLPVDPARITESVKHSWYDYAGGDDKPLPPTRGETTPKYTGPPASLRAAERGREVQLAQVPALRRRADGGRPAGTDAGGLRAGPASASRSWSARSSVSSRWAPRRSSPRWDASPRAASRRCSWRRRSTTGWTPWRRTWASGDLRIHDNSKWDPSSWPKEAVGAGFHEAPRGSLGHWVQIKDGVIANYQCIVPSTWNAGPRDQAGKRGPYEASLLRTPVADPSKPLEILRTVHSFDPCMACGVHVVDVNRHELAQVRLP